MHFKKMATGLIAAGALSLLVGMFMDTTIVTEQGWQIHNLGLQARQQNLLILGGVLFIAGIVLFSTAKLKSTKEDDQAETEATERARAARKVALEEVAGKAREGADQASNFIQHQLSREAVRRPFAFDRIDRRLGVGLLVGASLGLASQLWLPWWVVAIACLIYAFRNVDSRAVQRHLLILHTALYGIGTVLTAAIATAAGNAVLVPGIVLFSIPAVISGIWLFYIRKKID